MILNKAPTVGAVRSATLTTTPQDLIQWRDSRSFLYVQSATAFLIGFGATEPTVGIPIAAGAAFNPTFPPGDKVWLWVATGTATAVFAEG